MGSAAQLGSIVYASETSIRQTFIANQTRLKIECYRALSRVLPWKGVLALIGTSTVAHETNAAQI
jgi:hypothetical protein